MHRDDDDLDAVLARARQGCGEAFAELWRRFAPKVRGYAHARGVRDADDVTSEVFLAVFRQLPSTTGDGAAVRRWLFTIAHHKVVDALRRRARDERVEPYEVEVTDPEPAPSAESDFFDHFEVSAVSHLLASLASVQRDVLLMRVMVGLSVTDVASVVGKSPQAVRQIHSRALAQLRREMTADRKAAVTKP